MKILTCRTENFAKSTLRRPRSPLVQAGKGKEKVPPPPPPHPPPPPADKAAPEASTLAHPFFKILGFMPSGKLPTRFAIGDHRNTKTNVDAVAVELAKMDDRVAWLQNDITEVADTLNTKVHDVQQDVHELHNIVDRLATSGSGAAHHNRSIDDLINASNQHGANSAITQKALQGLNARMAAFEDIPPTQAHVTRITSIKARLDTLTEVNQKILAPVTPAVVPAAASADVDLMDLDPAVLKDLVRQFVNANGKRTRNDVDDARNVRQNTAPIAMLPLQVTTSLSPFPPAAPPTVSAVPPSTLPPSAPQYPGDPPPAAMPPSAPSAPQYPGAPAAPAESPQPPLTHQVLFGPINFGGDPKLAKGVMSRILGYVIPTPARVSFRLCRAHDKHHTHAVFESEAMATWVIDSWATCNGLHADCEGVTARRPNA
ncbi:hypothetical protein B0H10DRAFT_2222827 [Mycena sp. CBHHK59/15]|nr:hypothetical protein B0H10DRAFT_2222827 [Mycena sp. CBHHK59/15]